MKIKLIAPLASCGILGMKISLGFAKQKYGGAPLALPTIAALTPPGIDVSIVDENVEGINFSDVVDLVGISFNVAGVKRAYQIADEYRNRGIPVVLGGVYTSLLSQEAAHHADAVVIGEAENIWQELLNDFQCGRLKKVYHSHQWIDLKNSPIPRWDLLKTKSYNYHSLQTTRGCPFDCDFCSVTYIFGGSYRHKPIRNIVNEIKYLKTIDKNKLIFFVDDNISNNRTYAKELFNALIPLNIRWFSQSPIIVARDSELLNLMYKSGCRELFIGFESISQDSLEAMKKGKVNIVEEYGKSINEIYSHGISIFGSFMLGGEFDDNSIFKKTTQFINDNNIPFSLINIIVPPPGTRLFQRLDKENRILHKDFEKYSGEFVIFIPNKMSQQSLQEGFYSLMKDIYSYKSIYGRLSRLWSKGLLISQRKLNYYKFKIIFLFLINSLIRMRLKNFWFFLKCVLNRKKPTLTPIMLSISLHEYADGLLKSKA